MEYITTTYECSSYKDILISEKNNEYYIKLRENKETKEWSIIDSRFDTVTAGDLLSRAKTYSKYIYVELNENSAQSLINIFKQNKIRVKLQLNLE